MQSNLKQTCLLIAGLLLACAAATAQDFRGAITGAITDATGANVPNAKISVRNIATNTAIDTVTDANGGYTVLYLLSGEYEVSVTANGFKQLVRKGISIQVGDKRTLNLTLELGAVNESVTVTSDAPLLESETGTAGQIIDQRRISELPLSDGNPFVLARLASGIAITGGPAALGTAQQPFANQTVSDFKTNGVAGGNQFTLDGVPNQNGNQNESNVAFVPPADAVQEFKVSTASFDAQQGHTGGATVEVSLKSGTNKFHGTLYEFVRNDAFSANSFFANRAGVDQQSLRYNRFGATIGGPVFLPRFGEGGKNFYNGRNRTFFFFAYEELIQKTPSTAINTVPTAAQREGDFRALLAQGITIYDPATARVSGTRVVRDPFLNNLIPANRISPIARNYLRYYPLPNQPGDATGRDNFNSFFGANTNDFDSQSVRIDQTVSQKQRFFVRYGHNFRLQNRENFTGTVNGLNPSGTFEFRTNHNAAFDHIYNFNATTLLNVRLGYVYWIVTAQRQHQNVFDPATLGFSPQTVSQFAGDLYLPRFSIGGFSSLGESRGSSRTTNLYSFQPTLTKIAGKHNWRAGYDFRSFRENNLPTAHSSGQYTFGTDFTRQNDQAATAATIGQQFAAFLLGLPTTNEIVRGVTRSNQTLYHGVFVQDDWKVSRKLTLNLGLRYEYEAAPTERFNRNVRGFDFDAASPIAAQATAAYAASPIPELPASAFKVRGGLLFADTNNRSFFGGDKNNWQPRVGFAYKFNKQSVVRGGYAHYAVPLNTEGVNQPGFSQTTTQAGSNDRGLTFAATIFNPFPNGVVEPAGASLGLATFIGQDVFITPANRKLAQVYRYELNVQRELPGGFLLEVGWTGNHVADLSVGVNLNTVPRQYLSTSPIRDQNQINFLTALVPNPFRGLAPGTTLNNATIARQQLLRPFPQFGAVDTYRQDGTNDYNAGRIRIEKRFKRGYSFLATYTRAKNISRDNLLNDTDAEIERRIDPDDVPHRFVMSGIYEVPIGRNRRFGGGMNRVLDALIGGYQLSGIYQYQNGRPMLLGNIYFTCGDKALKSVGSGATVDGAFGTSCFYFDDAAVQTNGVLDPVKQRNDQRIRLASNVRTLPTRLDSFREQPLWIADLSVLKNFRVIEGVRLQFRAEFLNAFNHALFNTPNRDPTNSNFTKITSQGNRPRDVQLGLKLIF